MMISPDGSSLSSSFIIRKHRADGTKHSHGNTEEQDISNDDNSMNDCNNHDSKESSSASWFQQQRQQPSNNSYFEEVDPTMTLASTGSLPTTPVCTNNLTNNRDATSTNLSTTERESTTSTPNTESSAATNDRPEVLLPSRYTPPTTRLRDIIGHAAVKIRLDELLLPLALPTDVTRRIWTGLRASNGGGSGDSIATPVLLFGPPGCGKTQLAQAVAGEAQAAYIQVGPSDILSKFVGESEAAVRAVFQEAHHAATMVDSRTAVVFWDEIDALGMCRNNGGGGGSNVIGGDSDGCGRRILAELLMQFNKVTSSSPFSTSSASPQAPPATQNLSELKSNQSRNVNNVRILLLAATNRPEDCDPALLRRFGMRLYVGCPTTRDRRKLLRQYLRDIPHTLTKHDVRNLAGDVTNGWSGSEIEHLTREAVMAPIRECLQYVAQQRRQRRRRHRKRKRDVMIGTSLVPHNQAKETVLSTTAANSSIKLESEHDADDDDDDKATEQARQVLLQNLESLRPVNVSDFTMAVAFIVGQTSEHGSSNSHDAPRYDSSSSSSSSSSSEDEDDKDENGDI